MKNLFILSILLFSCTTQAQVLEGKVVRVADGDTFTMLVAKREIKIRLHGIDCPEKAQDFGNVAKTFLSDMVAGKVVRVEKMDTDRYGRTIGMVFIGEKNVNEELLRAGLAWHYKYYDKNTEWSLLEEAARKKKKGLWIDSNAMAPWEWRKRKQQ